MLQKRLAAALIVPLMQVCLAATAQMLPVENLPAPPQPTTSDASARAAVSAPWAATSGSLYRSSAAEGGAAGGVLSVPQQINAHRMRAFSAAAIMLKANSFGPGMEFATPLSQALNLRAGGNYLDIHYPFNVDGIDYASAVKFTSAHVTVDWFPRSKGFHISPGVLYFKNTMAAGASVTAGGSFELSKTNYMNSVDDPVHGTATLKYSRQIAPMLLVGFGNMLPRSGRHLSVPVEFGAAYMGPATIDIQLGGTACTTDGCFNAATEPTTQANLHKEINDLNQKIKLLEFYPIVSLGLAYRF